MAENYSFLDVNGKEILILGDLQIPFHDEIAIRTAINSGQYDTIILAGDIIDCHSISYFERDPRCRDFNVERLQLIQFYKYLRFHFPKQKIYFLEGNHEYRLTRWLWDHPEMYNIDELKAESMLRCVDFDIEYVSGRTLKLGDLNVVHGHEIRGGGQQPAKTFVQKCMENIVTFHFHKTQEWIETRLDGSMIGGWSVGCLCGLRPRWLPVNKWNHGFAHVKLLDNGKFEVYNKKIYNGAVY
jgi:predicted phosphodiesterase